MKNPINLAVIKKKPVVFGSVIIGGGLLFYFLFMRGGEQETQTSATMGYTDTQVAAASQLATYQQQAYLQGQEIQGQLALANISAGNALAVAQTDADVQKTLGAFALENSRLALARDIEGIRSAERVQTYGMDTSAQIAAMQYQTQLAGLQSNNETQVALQQLATQGQVAIAGMASQVSMAGIQAQADISAQTIQATTQQIKYQNELQLGLGAQNVQIKQIEADAAKYASGKQASAQKSGSKWGAIASVAGAAILAFSDIEIKTIHGCVKTSDCLAAIESMPIDFWKYLESAQLGPEEHVGTYAQEFYRALGCGDWSNRRMIHHVDMFGALSGAIKEIAKVMRAPND